MGWQGSNRRARLPADWPTRRARILDRDGHRCQSPGCDAPATDVDHIERGDDHNDRNLQALCHVHHASKSSAEGHAARPRARRESAPHPGLLPTPPGVLPKGVGVNG